ncbi:MAG TPA: fructosamine kinase family protein [Solirubrobacteraceae bacterium]
MTLPSSIAGRAVTSTARVSGGDINNAHRVILDDGTVAFVKTRADPGPGEYATEAAALRWLAEPAALPVPEVIDVGDDFLALEWLEEGGRVDEEELGRGLARIHAVGAKRIGAAPPGAPVEDLRIGPLVFDDEPSDDWPAFYAERRLLALLDRASLGASGRAAVEAVCSHIHDLAGPQEPPARLHGDLWSGNVLASGGRPYLIDPAAYGGHREIDLAMLRLFGGVGGPSSRFLAAYEEVAPLSEGHEERVQLYQLFPLLVHAALFGGGYAQSVERAAERYL